jgi:hypothetical protein
MYRRHQLRPRLVACSIIIDGLRVAIGEHGQKVPKVFAGVRDFELLVPLQPYGSPRGQSQTRRLACLVADPRLRHSITSSARSMVSVRWPLGESDAGLSRIIVYAIHCAVRGDSFTELEPIVTSKRERKLIPSNPSTPSPYIPLLSV